MPKRNVSRKKENYAGSKTLPALIKYLRKRRHIGMKCCESPPTKGKRKLVGIWGVADSPLLQTQTLRARLL
jgi:hypothetical protein